MANTGILMFSYICSGSCSIVSCQLAMCIAGICYSCDIFVVALGWIGVTLCKLTSF